MLLLLVISHIFNPVHSKSFECLKSGKIRYMKDNQYISYTKHFCFNHSKYKVISFSCLRNKNCQAIKSYQKNVPMIHSQIGNPYHRKCSLLKGTPKFIEYNDGKKWIKTAICDFKDSSFISIFNRI